MYINTRTNQLMANPSIRSNPIMDLYISPQEYDPGAPMKLGKELTLRKGQSTTLGGVAIRFDSFEVDREKMMQGGKELLIKAHMELTPSGKAPLVKADCEEIARAAPETVTAQPRGSVLLLADFTGASFDEEALRAMKESAVFDKPYIKKSAWVGAENLPKAFKQNLKDFSHRQQPDAGESLAYGFAGRGRGPGG